MTALDPQHVKNLLEGATPAAPNAHLAALAPDLAREWLRMRDTLDAWRYYLQSEIGYDMHKYSVEQKRYMQIDIDKINEILGGTP